MKTIELLQPTNEQRNRWANSEGRVFLDTPPDLDLRITKTIQELTEANEMKKEAALGFALQQTNRNRSIFEAYRVNAARPEKKLLDVAVYSDGERTRLDKLRVGVFRDRQQEIEVELVGPAWITDLEETALNETELPEFEFTIPNIDAAWSDPTALLSFLVADYGGWHDPPGVTTKDIRPIFNLGKLAKAMFCQHGWTFKSPYFLAEPGKRISAYLSGQNWYTYETKNDEFRVDLEIATPRNLTGAPSTILFDEISDPLDLYDSFFRPSEYLFPPGAPQDTEIIFKIEHLTANVPAYTGADAWFYFIVFKNNGTGTSLDAVHYEARAGLPDGPTQIVINAEFSDFAGPGVSYSFYMGYGEGGNVNSVFYPYELAAGQIQIKPNRPFLLEGDTFNPAELLDPEMNQAELLNEIARICNAKIETDYATNTVILYPPYDTNILGEKIEGFFQRNKAPLNFDKKIEPGSAIIDPRIPENNRYIELKFKDTNDAYIQQQFPDRQPFSKRVDLGAGKADTTTIEFDHFEPTVERFVDASLVGGNGMHLPVCRDNNDGNISKDIGKRILVAYGNVRQETGSQILSWNFEGLPRLDFPYFSQYSRVDFTPTVPRYQLTFANNQFGLWTTFYRQWIQETYDALTFEFLAYLTMDDYEALNFRRPVAVFYDESNYLLQPIKVADFEPGGNTATPIELNLIRC